ncbi:MAG: DEAD/DEAH box helicase [Brevinematales bacterium]|nr:DEAD/DEAH box helicase [Brevinematales bacterium]
MITKMDLISEFGDKLYRSAMDIMENVEIVDISSVSFDDKVTVNGEIKVDGECFYISIDFDILEEKITKKSCSCGAQNCEHMLIVLMNFEDKKTVKSNGRKVADKKLLPLEVLVDFSQLRSLSLVRIKFDLADKKLARSPKNYVYEYIIDDVKTIKVTPEDDLFLRTLISQNNIYTYPDEGIALSMSQFIKIIDLLKRHPRVYIYPSHEPLEITDDIFYPKLKIVYEDDNGLKKLKIITVEDYSDIRIIADGNTKRVLRGNKLYTFNNPIPIENWFAILENKFKISEREFPKFFGKFYEILSTSSNIILSEEINTSKPVIVEIDKIDVKLYLDYNESIEKLYWEPIVIYKEKETRVKDLLDVLVNHIEISDNHFISDLKAFRQRVLNELYGIGLKEYLISLNNLSSYISIPKEEFIKNILVNYRNWKDRVELSSRTRSLVPAIVNAIFDIDIHTEGKNDFRFDFKVFLVDNDTSYIKDVGVETFIRAIREASVNGVINISGKYYKIENLGDIQRLIDKIKSINLGEKDEGSILKLIKIISLEDDLLDDRLIQSLRIRRDSKVEDFRSQIKSLGRDSNIQIPSEIENVIREYQKVGYYWLHFLYKNNFGGVLADDMGLGKTLQALSFIKSIKDNFRGLPSLVICPTSLTHNWAREIEKFFPTMKYTIVSGKPKDREELVNNFLKYDVIITSYALIRNDIDLYLDKNFEVVVLDEAQYIKNKEAKITKYVKMLNSNIKIALTGTPIENSVSDLWSIFDFIMPNTLGSYQSFVEKYSKPENHGELAKMISYFILRRKKDDVLKELPKKIEQNIFVPLSPEQSEIYEKLVKEIRINILKQVGEVGFEKSKLHILSALTKLRQVCNHPYLISDEYKNVKSGKMELLMDLLDDAIEGGHKVLLFSQFVEMLKIIREEFDKIGIKYSYLDGSTKKRQEVIDEFNKNDDMKVFLISLKAGGFGLNLTSADIVILYDPWWNPMIEKQAMDRAHRIGQTKTVNVYKLLTENTIEEKILALQESKRSLFSNIVEVGSSTLSSITWDEIKSLLEM